jgi:hypothetical protein
MSKPKYKTYYITETIHIHQEVPARSKAHALKIWAETMADAENRVVLTTEGCTSTSSTSSEVVVRTPEEQEERDWELECDAD